MREGGNLGFERPIWMSSMKMVKSNLNWVLFRWLRLGLNWMGGRK